MVGSTKRNYLFSYSASSRPNANLDLPMEAQRFKITAAPCSTND